MIPKPMARKRRRDRVVALLMAVLVVGIAHVFLDRIVEGLVR